MRMGKGFLCFVRGVIDPFSFTPHDVTLIENSTLYGASDEVTEICQRNRDARNLRNLRSRK